MTTADCCCGISALGCCIVRRRYVNPDPAWSRLNDLSSSPFPFAPNCLARIVLPLTWLCLYSTKPPPANGTVSWFRARSTSPVTERTAQAIVYGPILTGQTSPSMTLKTRSSTRSSLGRERRNCRLSWYVARTHSRCMIPEQRLIDLLSSPRSSVMIPSAGSGSRRIVS